MELGALNTTDETLYSAVVMMIQGITVIVGLASLLFVVACLVSAFCAFFQETTRPVRRMMKPSPEPDTQDIPAGPDAERESRPCSLPQAMLTSTSL